MMLRAFEWAMIVLAVIIIGMLVYIVEDAINRDPCDYCKTPMRKEAIKCAACHEWVEGEK